MALKIQKSKKQEEQVSPFYHEISNLIYYKIRCFVVNATQAAQDSGMLWDIFKFSKTRHFPWGNFIDWPSQNPMLLLYHHPQCDIHTLHYVNVISRLRHIFLPSTVVIKSLKTKQRLQHLIWTHRTCPIKSKSGCVLIRVFLWRVSSWWMESQDCLACCWLRTWT